MGSGTRLSERWFNRALWVVALLFAGCLIGLGSLVVDDLPEVEQPFTLEQFLDHSQADAATDALAEIHRAQDDNRRRTAQAQLALEAARTASANAQATFANWLKTRDATQRVDQDPGLVARTEKLDELKAAERTLEEQMAALAKTDLDLTEREAAQARLEDEARASAQAKLEAANERQDLRVFGYRLAFTLPLLVLAGWLLLKRRHTRNWPFVWGFAFAAAFAFFVELVPYLPSYGGYVQYGVGLVATLIAGRAAIQAFQRYIERQRAEEARPKESAATRSSPIRRWRAWPRRSAPAANGPSTSRTAKPISAPTAGSACSSSAHPAAPARAPLTASVSAAVIIRIMPSACRRSGYSELRWLAAHATEVRDRRLSTAQAHPGSLKIVVVARVYPLTAPAVSARPIYR
jgi:hypothetical protein